MHLQDKFAADRLRELESLGIVRVEYHLHQALAIPQINEDDAPVIATTMDPATEVDFLTQMLFRDLSTTVAAHI